MASHLPTHKTDLFTELNGTATPSREEDAVASLYARGDNLAVLVGGTRADGDDGRLRKGLAGC